MIRGARLLGLTVIVPSKKVYPRGPLPHFSPEDLVLIAWEEGLNPEEFLRRTEEVIEAIKASGLEIWGLAPLFHAQGP